MLKVCKPKQTKAKTKKSPMDIMFEKLSRLIRNKIEKIFALV